jgi:hypothetical protein
VLLLPQYVNLQRVPGTLPENAANTIGKEEQA